MRAFSRYMVIFLATLLPGVAWGQECAVFEAIPPHASLTVRSSITTSSRSPMKYCRLTPDGRYLLDLFAPGYEERTLKFSLGDNGALRLKGNRRPYMLRSVVIPGAGIWANGHKIRGGWMFAVTAFSGYGAIRTWQNYDDARDYADQLRTRVALANTIPEAEALAEQLVAAELDADAQQDRFYATAAMFGWIYLGNLVETYLLASPPEVRSLEGSTAVLATPFKSSKRAFWRSLFYPGLGQSYLGRHVRAFFFQTGFLAAAYLSIEARLEYDQAVNERVLAARQINQAQTVPEIESALQNFARASDKVKDKETERDVFYIITGSLWLLNVIDAAFSSPPKEPARVKLETSYSRSTLHTGLSLRF